MILAVIIFSIRISIFSLYFLDEGDGTTSPLNLPQANSDHDDDESGSDFSDKGMFIFHLIE